jgi:RHS repeat-associated protein
MGCLKLNTHTHLKVVRTSETTRSGEGKYRAGRYKYKFQGQERQDELGLNWDSFKWRNYDMAIGRFMSIDPLAEDYVYNGPYNFAENRVIDGRELEGLEWVPSTQMQQFNESARTFGRSVAGAIDLVGAKVSAFFSITREIAPNTKVETTTTASFGLNNTLNFVNAKQFDQNTTVSPFTAKIETKVEVKVTIADIKAKVEGVDVNTKVLNVTNVTAGTNKTEAKTVVGSGQSGVFVSNSTNNKTGENTTRAGVQVQAETPKVVNATFKVGMSASIGQEEKKKPN